MLDTSHHPSRTRRAVLLGAAAASGALSAACSLDSLLRGNPLPPEKHPPTSIEFWGGPSADQRRDQVAAWNAKYPHLKVTFQSRAAVGAGVDALRSFAASVASGTAPQVVDFDRFQVAAYANWSILSPLDDYVRRDGMSLSAFTPAVLGEATGLDKRLYGLPSGVDNRLLYWNRQHFAEAGLDPEKPPASWDQLKDYAVRLTRSRSGEPERLGFHTQEGQSTLHLFAWQNGGGFLTPDGKKVTLDHPPNQEALEWMADLMASQGEWSRLKAFRDTWAKDGAQQGFLSGRLSMQYQINQWDGGALARSGSGFSFGVAPPPPRKVGDKPLTWSGGYSYVMSRNARAADAAWAFLKWLVSEEAWNVALDAEAARARASGGVYLPGLTGQPDLDKKLSAKFKTGVSQVDRVSEVALDLMQHTRFREPCIAGADLWEAIVRAQEEAVSGLKPPKQALEEHNARAQRALEQAWVFVPRR